MQYGPSEFFRAIDAEKRDLLRRCRPHDVLSFKLHALRLLNVLTNKYEYSRSAVRKLGRPSGFMLDPANACQLGCPTCQHSWNKRYTAATYAPMQKGIMREDTFDVLMRELGPYAYVGHLYNNSEPFLNKRLYDFLAHTNRFRINTLISSNLSLPSLDHESIVTCGLNTLMVAIDGTTQSVYERYRRGGTLELVLDNVARIVEAKRKLKSPTPHLRWQFLTFEHNVHQVEDAIEVARGIGFDSFNIATPFDVSGDDPTIEVALHPRASEGNHTLSFTAEPSTNAWPRALAPLAETIDAAWNECLAERHEDQPRVWNEVAATEPALGHCDWLHVATIADAKGSILPCCIPDYASHGSFVFGSVARDAGDLFNTSSYLQARALLATGVEYPGLTESNSLRHVRAKCAGCAHRPPPQVGLDALRVYLSTPTNESYGNWLDADCLHRLTGWSRHDLEAKQREAPVSPTLGAGANAQALQADQRSDGTDTRVYSVPFLGRLMKQRDRLIRERRALLRERDRAAIQYTRLLAERDALVHERNQLGELRYRFEHERDVVIAERDRLVAKLRENLEDSQK